VGNLIAYHSLGQPVQTPRRYEALTAEGYQKNIIVYRAVTLISRSLSSVPLVLYEGRNLLDTHPLLTLLKCPSPRQAGSAFIESVVAYLLLAGNTYIEAVSSPHTGLPCELYPLRPDRIRVIPGEGGVPKAYEYSVNGNKRLIGVNPLNGKSSVLHLKTFHPLNDWYGLSPLEAAAVGIDQHNIVSEHNLSLLQNGARPTGAFILKQSHDYVLTAEQREHLQNTLREKYKGARGAGNILMLEGDFEWQEMGLSPKDMDYVEGKYLSAREIAQAFGVPAMLVGVPGEATFANYKEARLHLWEDTILPLLEFIIAELNLWLAPLFGSSLVIAYDTEKIPALAPKREAAWSKIGEANFLTLNEKRQALGYPPLPNGDTL